MKRIERIHAGSAAQSGQAMVEFLVSMTAVMSVLFLGIVMLGKFNDIRNRTLMGSRYVAWERTVWSDNDPTKHLTSDPSTTESWSSIYGNPAVATGKTDAELQHEVMQRFMAGDGAAISSADRRQTSLPSSQPAMWYDYGGQPLLGAAGDVVVSTSVGNDPSSSQTSAATMPFGSTKTSTNSTYLARLSLPTRTLHSGTLSVSIAKNSAVLQNLWPKNGVLPAFGGLTFKDTNVLLTNAWVPDGSNNNLALFSQAVPAAKATLIQPSTYLGLQKYAPEITTLQFGRIRQDVVPPNRLSP